ncbi:hypothetical protein PIIN_09322 [Serendipita indica DSM 11827]|uniref:ubiquitinyl hydrolase 1 n=1 Tax=Serendipita indica (strain DSM 11827) TaxID=1109443 RepID=G4TVJ4_SERID|nr:hypothetical protein PIIN_09322 [Serendipita indica DSM 11827]
MPLELSQLVPTFISLLNPSTWLSSSFQKDFPYVLRYPFAHARAASVAAARKRPSVALSPDDDNLSSDSAIDTSIQEGSESINSGERRKRPAEDEDSSEQAPRQRRKMTQLALEDEYQGNSGSHHHQRSTSGNTQGSAQAKHHKSSSGGGESGLDRSTTPTQSNTLAQAKRPQLDELSPRDLGSLTQEQIAQLQANMLEDLQDADARPLVSTVQPMETLMNEYSSNPNFLRKMEWLKKQGWLGVRRTKGDGDCFYRSFAFAWVERILRAKDQEFAVASAISTLNSTWLGLKDVGFETVILEDFYDVLRSLVEQIITPEAGGQALNASLLLEAFTSPEASNSIVSYVRMLTSAEIRRNREDYAAFIVHPETQEAMPVDEFCNQFVDAMGKEADHVQMQALAKALGVNLSVAYLDGNIGSNNDDAAVDFVKFDNGGGSDANGIDDVVLLYRPGHYDILEHRAHEHRPSAASTLVTSSVMA